MLPPLIVPETNIFMDIWLGRDQAIAKLLLPLATSKTIDLFVSEHSLLEFRGTALVWLRTSRRQIETVQQSTRNWRRTDQLGENADEIGLRLKRIDAELPKLQERIDEVIEQIGQAATIFDYTADIQFRGDQRFLAGLPPDEPGKGLKDCRLFEAVLEIAKSDHSNQRPWKAFITKDTDFEFENLHKELGEYNFEIRRDIGALLGRLISS